MSFQIEFAINVIRSIPIHTNHEWIDFEKWNKVIEK